MFTVLGQIWALLLGIFLLMVGNGLHGTLVGIRGVQEDFTTLELSLIMSGYFVGFLFGSRLTPHMIIRVGHVRVFAALGSLISAALILFAQFPEAWVWVVLRIIIGIGFSGVYVVAESWLNDSSTNENRGKTLAIYISIQMFGIISAQGLFNLGDTSGYLLFVLASVLVSLSFTPILLSVSPTPHNEVTKSMNIVQLFKVSPLGVFGAFCLGAVFAALFGMAAVFGTRIGLTPSDIALFVAMIYIGSLIFQFPIGYISDRMDRRKLILSVAVVCTVFSCIGAITEGFLIMLIVTFVIGATTTPLYSLLIAYTNDYLEVGDMPAGASGLIFVNGLGAISGPFFVGWLMDVIGPYGFFIYIAITMTLLAIFCVFRMAMRNTPDTFETMSYAPISPTSTPVVADMAQEFAIDQQTEEEENNLGYQ